MTILRQFLRVSDNNMKFTGIIFILFVIIGCTALIVDSLPSEKRCKDKCDETFERLICSQDGDEMMSFSGKCRLKQFNECYGTSSANMFIKSQNNDILQITNLLMSRSADRTKSSYINCLKVFLNITIINGFKQTRPFIF